MANSYALNAGVSAGTRNAEDFSAPPYTYPHQLISGNVIRPADPRAYGSLIGDSPNCIFRDNIVGQCADTEAIRESVMRAQLRNNQAPDGRLRPAYDQTDQTYHYDQLESTVRAAQCLAFL